MKKKNIYIVHGYKAHADKHWFPWLIEQLKSDQTTIKSLTLPNPEEPIFEEWAEAIDQQIHGLDEDTYFIGHSLGTITLLKYLSQRLGEDKIGGLVLVAPFDTHLAAHPELDSFISHSIDYELLANHIDNRHIFCSANDTTVPAELSEEISIKLFTTIQQMKDCGHFCECDGMTTFPEIHDYLSRALKRVKKPVYLKS